MTMKRRALWTPRAGGLLASLIVLGACVQAPQPSPSPTPTGASSVQVKFFSSIAFVPTNPGQTPMTDGYADSVLAVLPRAYDPDVLASPPVPDVGEFNPGPGKVHEPHHLMLKIPANNLGGPGTEEIIIPVRPPANDTDVYDITVEGLASSTDKLQYSGFGSVASILDGSTTDPPIPATPSVAAVSGAGALARMSLGAGWKLTLPPSPAPLSGTTAFLQCPRGATCSSQQATSVGVRSFALAVQADSPPVMGPVAIRVSNGGVTVMRVPLVPSAGSLITFKILHAPLSEMYGGTMGDLPLHHFKLFNLLADPIRRPYYFPQLAHTAAMPLKLTDPFCTPVAQFKPR
jgi:hypothetical protein